MKSRQVNFCLGELLLKLLAWIGEWHQNLKARSHGAIYLFVTVIFLKYFLCDLRASVHTVRFCVNAFAKLEIFVLL